MITATKEFSWAMAHRLEGHKGLCNNLHGHEYKLFVTMSYGDHLFTEGSSKGMVIDFKDLKNIVNKQIVDKLDHTIAYNKDDKDIIKVIKKMQKLWNQKVFEFPFRVTAENMARWIYYEINKVYNRCSKVVLYETPTSFATYQKE